MRKKNEKATKRGVVTSSFCRQQQDSPKRYLSAVHREHWFASPVSGVDGAAEVSGVIYSLIPIPQ